MIHLPTFARTHTTHQAEKGDLKGAAKMYDSLYIPRTQREGGLYAPSSSKGMSDEMVDVGQDGDAMANAT